MTEDKEEHIVSVYVNEYNDPHSGNFVTYALIEVKNHDHIENIEFTVSKVHVDVHKERYPRNSEWNNITLNDGTVFLKYNYTLGYIFCKYSNRIYKSIYVPSVPDQYIIQDKLKQFLSTNNNRKYDACEFYYGFYYKNFHIELDSPLDMSFEETIKLAKYKCKKEINKIIERHGDIYSEMRSVLEDKMEYLDKI